MKKRIKLGLLSVAMGIVAVNGVSSSDNSNKSMAKADTIIEEEVDYSNVVAPQAMILPARIKSIDATYTGKENMSKVNVTFWTETNTFRIYTSVKTATSSSNKARLCVGDITMYF